MGSCDQCDTHTDHDPHACLLNLLSSALAPPFHIAIILVTKLSPVHATGEGNIAPAKRGKRAQFSFVMIQIVWKS